MILVAQTCFLILLLKSDGVLVTFRVEVPKVMECSTKTSFLEHARGVRCARGASGATLSGVIGRCSEPPSTRAGGQDDVSLNKLPQISHESYSVI